MPITNFTLKDIEAFEEMYKDELEQRKTRHRKVSAEPKKRVGFWELNEEEKQRYALDKFETVYRKYLQWDYLAKKTNDVYQTSFAYKECMLAENKMQYWMRFINSDWAVQCMRRAISQIKDDWLWVDEVNQQMKEEYEMNAENRKKLDRANEMLDNAKALIEEVADDEQDKFDNLSEGLQGAERGQRMEEVASSLQDVVGEIDNLMSSVEECKE